MSKKQHIRKALEEGRSLNPLVAMKEFGTMRLAAYIYMLRQDGVKIKTIDKVTIHGDKYAEYVLDTDEETMTEEVNVEHPNAVKVGEIVTLVSELYANVVETELFPLGSTYRVVECGALCDFNEGDIIVCVEHDMDIDDGYAHFALNPYEDGDELSFVHYGDKLQRLS